MNDVRELIPGMIKDVINQKYKTVILHFYKSGLTTKEFFNNISNVKAKFYNTKNAPYFCNPDTIFFGDEQIIPESLEHVNSLLGDNVFSRNNIILSKIDNMNVTNIKNQIQRYIDNGVDECRIICISSNGNKEVYRGIVYTSNSD